MHYEPAVHLSNIIYLIASPAVSAVGVHLLHCLVIFPTELVLFSAYKEFIISYRSQAFSFLHVKQLQHIPRDGLR